MLEKYNKYKILKVFLFAPTEAFRLRELSRLSKISPPSVINYLKEFEQEGLITSFEKRGIPFYRAERENELFSFYQKLAILYELNKSCLISFLWNKLSPEAIILYGSFARGEATEQSDIDLFILGKEREINIETFEEKINKHVHIIFEQDIKNITKELKNNLINGIVLKGYLKVL